MGLAAALVGGAAAIGGAVIASNGAKSAAKTAQQASDQASAVQQQIYSQNQATLRPYINAGMPATNAINALLGIGGGSPAPAAGQAVRATQSAVNPNANSYGEPILSRPSTWLTAMNRTANTTAQPTAQEQYQTAFDNYKNSTGYQFRLNQGLDAVNSGYAGAGTLKSGAAMQAINDYASGMASQEFGNYLNALGNQQALGFSAASAQAGVGQNYANNIGNIAMQNGANQANAALASSQNWANTLGSVGSIGAYYLGQRKG